MKSMALQQSVPIHNGISTEAQIASKGAESLPNNCRIIVRLDLGRLRYGNFVLHNVQICTFRL
jgi:hypothetical protein